MMVVLEVLNEEEKKRKLAVAAACLHVIEHGSATNVTGHLPNRTTTNKDATVKKITVSKVDKPECTLYHVLPMSFDRTFARSWKGRIFSLQVSSYALVCKYWLEDPILTCLWLWYTSKYCDQILLAGIKCHPSLHWSIFGYYKVTHSCQFGWFISFEEWICCFQSFSSVILLILVLG